MLQHETWCQCTGWNNDSEGKVWIVAQRSMQPRVLRRKQIISTFLSEEVDRYQNTVHHLIQSILYGDWWCIIDQLGISYTRVEKKEGRRGWNSDLYILKGRKSFDSPRNKTRPGRTILEKVRKRTKHLSKVGYESAVKPDYIQKPMKGSLIWKVVIGRDMIRNRGRKTHGKCLKSRRSNEDWKDTCRQPKECSWSSK